MPVEPRKIKHDFVCGSRPSPNRDADDVGAPRLWLAGTQGTDNTTTDIYLVNDSSESICDLQVAVGSAITVDDNAYGAGSPVLCYEVVEPGEAVRIDAYDEIYDRDFLRDFEFAFYTSSLGHVHYRLLPRKDSAAGEILLWGDGTLGRHVVVKEPPEPTTQR